MFVIIVFFPWTWPWTFGISNLSPDAVTTLILLYASFRSCSYGFIIIRETECF